MPALSLRIYSTARCIGCSCAPYTSYLLRFLSYAADSYAAPSHAALNRALWRTRFTQRAAPCPCGFIASPTIYLRLIAPYERAADFRTQRHVDKHMYLAPRRACLERTNEWNACFNAPYTLRLLLPSRHNAPIALRNELACCHSACHNLPICAALQRRLAHNAHRRRAATAAAARRAPTRGAAGTPRALHCYMLPARYRLAAAPCSPPRHSARTTRLALFRLRAAYRTRVRLPPAAAELP